MPKNQQLLCCIILLKAQTKIKTQQQQQKGKKQKQKRKMVRGFGWANYIQKLATMVDNKG